MEALTAPAVGTLLAPIFFTGYSSTVGDGGLATLDGNGGAETVGLLYVADARYHVWTNIRFTDYSGNGVDTDNASDIIFRFCEFDNNGATGCDSPGAQIYRCGCHAHDNTLMGIYGAVNTVIMGCTSSNNGTTGIWCVGGGGRVIGNTVDGNLQYGIVLSATPALAVGNTIFGNGKATDVGIFTVVGTHSFLIANNIIVDCAVGIKTDSTDLWENMAGSMHNLLFDNTTDYEDADTSLGELTSDPLFVDDAAGDFSLGAASPALDVGVHPTFSPNAPAQDGDTSYLGSTSTNAVAACDYPGVGDVEEGVSYDSGNLVGTFGVPAVGDVQDSIQFGAGGTEFTGTFTAPAVGDVEETVQFGAGGTEFTGTFGVPAVADVRDSTQYGAGGTEFTGELVAGGGGSGNSGLAIQGQIN